METREFNHVLNRRIPYLKSLKNPKKKKERTKTLTTAQEREKINEEFNITTNNLETEKGEKQSKKLSDIVHLNDNEQGKGLNRIEELEVEEQKVELNEMEKLNDIQRSEMLNEDAETKIKKTLIVTQDQATENDSKAAKKQVKDEAILKNEIQLNEAHNEDFEKAAQNGVEKGKLNSAQLQTDLPPYAQQRIRFPERELHPQSQFSNITPPQFPPHHYQ